MRLVPLIVVDLALSAGELLDEIVVVGYGTQKEKEITSSVTSVDAEDFNQGPINDPAQLLQGKVAGLQVYNRGGDPNGQSNVIRLRGISTVGANTEPLVVVDGIIGASLANVDPNDIESISVLKDGSAAAIYGTRGSSGVILVTTRSGGDAGGGVQFTYNGQVGVSSAFNSVPVMARDEFLATGGTDLGSSTDWVDEVTRTGTSNVHSLAASGAIGTNSNFRISGNYRNTQGILENSGFEQFNARLNFSTKAFNDRLSIDFNSSFTNRDSEFWLSVKDCVMQYCITQLLRFMVKMHHSLLLASNMVVSLRHLVCLIVSTRFLLFNRIATMGSATNSPTVHA